MQHINALSKTSMGQLKVSWSHSHDNAFTLEPNWQPLAFLQRPNVRGAASTARLPTALHNNYSQYYTNPKMFYGIFATSKCTRGSLNGQAAYCVAHQLLAILYQSKNVLWHFRNVQMYSGQPQRPGCLLHCATPTRNTIPIQNCVRNKDNTSEKNIFRLTIKSTLCYDFVMMR